MMAEVTLSLEEYEALRSMAHDNSCINCSGSTEEVIEVPLVKPKRKPTAYNRKYSKAFKSIQSYTNSRMEEQNGYKNCCKAANRCVRMIICPRCQKKFKTPNGLGCHHQDKMVKVIQLVQSHLLQPHEP